MANRTRIEVTQNGPYRVTDCQKLQGVQDGKTYPSDGTVALCRCGGSKNKPFCDGAHAKIGFSGDKEPDRTADRRESYAGPEVTVHDNRGICAHAGTCTNGLAKVFRLGEEPWIDPAGASADEIIKTVSGCPSGALSYSREGVEHRDLEAEPMIAVVPNGPYAIRGGAELTGATWGEGASQQQYTLCRCGKSKNKPFCNGAHWNHHFDEDAPAPKD